MKVDANEKELSVWGFAGGLRTGLITFILALLIMSNIYLYIDRARADKEKALSEAEKLILQEKLYERMIQYIKPTTDRMNTVADKVDTAATRAINSANAVDSITNRNNKPKPLKR
jgi:hypothetical protein